MRSFLGDETALAKQLAAINRRMSSSLDFEETLRLIPRSATELLGGAACLLLRDEEDVLRIRASHGVDPSAAAEFSAHMAESVLRDLPNALRLPSALEAAGAPVMADQRVQGILVLLREASLDREGTWLLSALADQAAVTLRNARLYEHVVGQERLLEAEVQRARRLSSELDELIHTVAHDLRAPLRAMTGCGELLLEEYAEKISDGRGHDYLERIASGAYRMEALLLGLLDYTNLTRASINLGPLSLEGMVRKGIEEQESEIRSRAATVQMDVPPVMVLADRKILRMAIQNLLSNALKFISPGTAPHVDVRAEPRGSVVRLWVEDNGIGIDPTQAHRIFGLFERLNRAEDFPGTGMGLALVRKGIERMGGDCGVEPRPGGGSRFWIDLRRAPTP